MNEDIAVLVDRILHGVLPGGATTSYWEQWQQQSPTMTTTIGQSPRRI